MSEAIYGGVGETEAIAELHELVGRITAFWAGVEDSLFNIFVIALTGTWRSHDLRPYRAVFFSFNSYEQKMRMVNNAMKSRFDENKEILEQWASLRKSLDNAAALRNEIAHLIPSIKPTANKNAQANARLTPPFWKSVFPRQEFETMGYSKAELLDAISPFWGPDPRIAKRNTPDSLGYRLHQFALALVPNSGIFSTGELPRS